MLMDMSMKLAQQKPYEVRLTDAIYLCQHCLQVGCCHGNKQHTWHSCTSLYYIHYYDYAHRSTLFLLLLFNLLHLQEMFRRFHDQLQKSIPYSRKIWQFGGLHYNRQIKISQNFLLAYIHVFMVIPYRTAKFKYSCNSDFGLNCQI